MSVQFGFCLPAGPPKGQIATWAEDMTACFQGVQGEFDSLWMTDHFFWDDNPTYEAWTVLAFFAARWPQCKIGPMVLGQGYRNPALLAKMGATLQMLSRGGFILGIGAGWKEDEYRAYGYGYPSPGTRVAQLEDALEIITRMWTQPGPVTYAGRHYSVINAWCEPHPDPVPPILVGGGGNKTLRLAARFANWWNMHDANWPTYSAMLEALDAHCAEIGRDPATLRRTWFGRLVLGATEQAALELGGGKWTPNNAFVGTPEQVIAQMRPFVEAGVDYFMVDVVGLPRPHIVSMLLGDVLPAVRAIAARR